MVRRPAALRQRRPWRPRLPHKTEIARTQATRALQAGITIDWAAGDEVFGRSSTLRDLFEQHHIGYVFAVGTNFTVNTAAGPLRADLLTAQVPRHGWNRRSCGQGAKGPRVYDWAMIATSSDRHKLLVRRSVNNPTDLAYFYTYVPPGRPMTLPILVRIAGIRWAVEEDFQQSKDQVGLDHTQARRYTSWRRHITLAMAALALLAVIASHQRRSHPDPALPTHGQDKPPADHGLIALTVPETRRLFRLLTQLLHTPPADTPEHPTTFHLHWSTWRRRHQARARWHHYRTRLAALGW